MKRKKVKPAKQKPHSLYHKIHRQVDGAVMDTMIHHAHWFNGNEYVIRRSIVKRVAGQITGLVMAELLKDGHYTEGASM